MRMMIFLLLSVNLLASSFIPKQFEAQLEVISKSRFKKIIKMPLRLKYKFPKNVAMYIKSMTYVCNPETTWRYQPPFIEGEKGEVSIGKSSTHCFSALFDSLRHGFKKNKLYTVVKDIKNLSYKFDFIKKSKSAVGIDAITFKFDKALSEELTLNDVLSMKVEYLSKTQKPALYEIKKISTNVKFKSADFVFKIPKNTKKVYLK